MKIKISDLRKFYAVFVDDSTFLKLFDNVIYFDHILSFEFVHNAQYGTRWIETQLDFMIGEGFCVESNQLFNRDLGCEHHAFLFAV